MYPAKCSIQSPRGQVADYGWLIVISLTDLCLQIIQFCTPYEPMTSMPVPGFWIKLAPAREPRPGCSR